MDRPFIWFDFGGVPSPPIPELFELYHVKTGISPAQLQSAMRAVARELDMPMLAPVELGTLTERKWGKRLRTYLAETYPGLGLDRARLEEFGSQWFHEVRPNHVMVDTVRHFRENGFGVGILANNVDEWEPHWTKITAGVGEVTAIIDSCKIGARKPQTAIFRIAEKKRNCRRVPRSSSTTWRRTAPPPGLSAGERCSSRATAKPAVSSTR